MPMREAARQPRETQGAGTLLVLVDSSQSEYALLPETVFAALAHFGIPYQVLDLGRRQLSESHLAGHPGLLIGQEYIGQRLSADDIGTLLRAVQRGLGLVNLDPAIVAHPDGTFRDCLGLRGALASDRVGTGGTDAVVIEDGSHFITYTQDPGAGHRLRMPAPVAQTRVSGARTTELARTETGAPALIAVRVGEGRIVQWLISPKIWTDRFFGHARGMDDLFWKGIVWVARKPFIMKAMPPFVRLRFDDCEGFWRRSSDLAFVDVLNAFGHKPSLCLCVRAVSADGAGKIGELYQRGHAEFAPHTLAPGTSAFFGDEDGEYSESQLGAVMAEVDARFRQWHIRPSKVLSDHNHEFSARVLPYLKERGICFRMNITLPGERWTDLHVDWHPAPYGSMSCAFDYLPGSRDLFVVFNHYPTFDFARAYASADRFVFHRDGGFGDCKWDFLNGLTSGSRAGGNDIESAARRLAAHARLGLNSLFFGGSISHSHFVKDLSVPEWRALMQRYEELTRRLDKINVGYDLLAEYARSHVNTHLERVEPDLARPPLLRGVLSGEATVPLQIYVFKNVDDHVEHRFETVPAFSGRAEFVA
jgi:hypothetical protein